MARPVPGSESDDARTGCRRRGRRARWFRRCATRRRQLADRETESQRSIPPRQSVHDHPAVRGRDLYREAVLRLGDVSPTNFKVSCPRTTLGVTIHEPPQVAIATRPAAGGEAIAVNPLPMPPRMQNVTLNGT